MTTTNMPITREEAVALIENARPGNPVVLPWGSTRGLYLTPTPTNDWAVLAVAGHRMALRMLGR